MRPQQLVQSLSSTSYTINSGVLQAAHSIFNPWRAQVRSDNLFSTINFVLGRFGQPFIALFRQTAKLLLGGSSGKEEAQSMVLLVDIFYDLTCHDLPPAFEDTHEEFFAPPSGWFQRFLAWNPPSLNGEVCVPLSIFFIMSYFLFGSLMIRQLPFPVSSRHEFSKLQNSTSSYTLTN